VLGVRFEENAKAKGDLDARSQAHSTGLCTRSAKARKLAKHSLPQTTARTTAWTEFFSLADSRQGKTAGAAHPNYNFSDPRSGDTFRPATVRRLEVQLSRAVVLQLSANVERSGRLMPLLGCGLMPALGFRC
jgi:hypothetical protein